MFGTRALTHSLLALLIGTLPAAVSAEANAVDFLRLVKSGDQTAVQVLHAYAVGIQWHDAYDRQDRHLAPSICPPDRLAITKEQDISILENYVAKHPKMSNLPVGVVLVYAYVDTFPCKVAGKAEKSPAFGGSQSDTELQTESLITGYKSCIKKSAAQLARSRAEANAVADAAVENCEGDRRTIFQHVAASDGLGLATAVDDRLASEARSVAELAVVKARRK